MSCEPNLGSFMMAWWSATIVSAFFWRAFPMLKKLLNPCMRADVIPAPCASSMMLPVPAKLRIESIDSGMTNSFLSGPYDSFTLITRNHANGYMASHGKVYQKLPKGGKKLKDQR